MSGVVGNKSPDHSGIIEWKSAIPRFWLRTRLGGLCITVSAGASSGAPRLSTGNPTLAPRKGVTKPPAANPALAPSKTLDFRRRKRCWLGASVVRDQSLVFGVNDRLTLFPISSGIIARAISSSSFGGWPASPASCASYQSVQTSHPSFAASRSAFKVSQKPKARSGAPLGHRGNPASSAAERPDLRRN